MGSGPSESRGDHSSRIYFLDVKVRCGNTWDRQANELEVLHHRKGSLSGVVIKGETKNSERESAG